MPADYRPMPLLLVCLFWLLGVAGASAADTACDSNATGTVVAAKGLVEVTQDGKRNWRPLKAGTKICPDFSVRTGRNGMAAIWLDRERTMVRLKNSSSVTYSGRSKSGSLLNLLKGAGYLFSRTPVKLDVKTPHVNGGIEGTEFLLHVTASGDRSFIQVFEGVVSAQNASTGEKLFATQGETVTASFSAPPRKLSAEQEEDVLLWRALVQPLDQVQWALHYPLVTTTPSDIQVRLRSGDVEGARALLETAEVTADTLAVRLIIQIVQARGEAERLINLAQAERARNLYAQSEAIALALSYAQQAVGNVETAQDDLDQFATAQTSTPLLTLRRAELALINGAITDAIDLASNIPEIPDTRVRINTLLGFAALQQLRLKEAEGRFQTAVDADGFDPAARFGLGLTKIRRGDVAGGRQDLEKTTSLDKNVSLYRSYLGRAYFEERFSDKARAQYRLAKKRDPQDPTPWFFEAIQHFVENRPIDAYRALNESIERNNNRAVYRPKEALSDDLAVRGSVLSGIYRTLGLEELGIPEAAKAIATSPADHAGHRFLADLYADQSFQDYARASEILQAQLLQPLTLDPVRPQLAETDLTFLGGAGFNGISFNEYTTAFETNGHRLTLAGLGGNYGTAANELLFSGLQGKVGYNISQFHYETDGVRDNNDVRHDIVSAFVQGEINPRLRLQAEFRFRDTDQGDLSQNFDPSDFFEQAGNRIKTTAARFGGRFDFNGSNALIANFGYRDLDSNFFSESALSNFSGGSSVDGTSLQFQHIFSTNKLSLVSGLETLKDNIDIITETDISPGFGGICPPIFSTCRITSIDIRDRRKLSAYSYIHLKPWQGTLVTVGLSHEDLNFGAIGFDETFPKFGFVQEFGPKLKIRFSYTQGAGTDPETQPSIQATQVAGFAQTFDDGISSTNEIISGAVEFNLFNKALGHFSGSWRSSKFRLGGIGANNRFDGDASILELGGLIAVFPTHFVQLSTSPTYTNINTPDLLVTPAQPNFPSNLKSFIAPISIKLFSDWGASVDVTGTLTKQKLRVAPFSLLSDTSETFFVLDLKYQHRFLGSRGQIYLGIENILGTEFRYQETNQLLLDTPDVRFVDETLFTFGITIRL